LQALERTELSAHDEPVLATTGVLRCVWSSTHPRHEILNVQATADPPVVERA
jgi:hypothetical protein